VANPYAEPDLMDSTLAWLLIWAALIVGFLAGSWWSGRGRTGVRERATDFPPSAVADHLNDDRHGLTPEARERIWRRIQDGAAVEKLLRSL
jgi:hypothetical protein